MSTPIKDVVIRGNYFRNVRSGMYFDQGGGGSAAGRIIAHDNAIELSREIANPVAFRLTGNLNDQFSTAILRKNIVRHVQDATRSLRTDAPGISLERCTGAIAENNVLNDMGTSLTGYSLAMTLGNCGSKKCFNNQTTAGALLRGYDLDSGKYILELEDSVQDVLLAM